MNRTKESLTPVVLHVFVFVCVKYTAHAGHATTATTQGLVQHLGRVEACSPNPVNNISHTVAKRGINVFVVSPHNASYTQEIFDTYQNSAEPQRMVSYLSQIPVGDIVVAVSYDSVMSSTSQGQCCLPISARDSFGLMGSSDIYSVKYREAWIFSGIKGDNASVAEAYGSFTRFTTNAQANLQVYFRTSDGHPFEVNCKSYAFHSASSLFQIQAINDTWPSANFSHDSRSLLPFQNGVVVAHINNNTGTVIRIQTFETQTSGCVKMDKMFRLMPVDDYIVLYSLGKFIPPNMNEKYICADSLAKYFGSTVVAVAFTLVYHGTNVSLVLIGQKQLNVTTFPRESRHANASYTITAHMSVETSFGAVFDINVTREPNLGVVDISYTPDICLATEIQKTTTQAAVPQQTLLAGHSAKGATQKHLTSTRVFTVRHPKNTTFYSTQAAVSQPVTSTGQTIKGSTDLWSQLISTRIFVSLNAQNPTFRTTKSSAASQLTSSTGLTRWRYVASTLNINVSANAQNSTFNVTTPTTINSKKTTNIPNTEIGMFAIIAGITSIVLVSSCLCCLVILDIPNIGSSFQYCRTNVAGWCRTCNRHRRQKKNRAKRVKTKIAPISRNKKVAVKNVG